MNMQKLRAQIAALQDATMDENKNFRTAYDEGKFDALTAVDNLLDSLQEEPVSKLWHDASEEPNDMSHCLIFYGCKESVGHYLHYEPVLYNKKEKMFVTSSFPHPTGNKVEQKSFDGGCVAEVYKDKRDRISISDITQWCYLKDLHNFSNVERTVKNWKEEPVSKDLEEAANDYAHDLLHDDVFEAFIAGAQWLKKHLWKPADGDDLPDIDMEVIVLYQPYPCEGNEYAVSFAHRPHEFLDLKNTHTGEITRFEPARYDKGGWNIPDVKFWLDCDLPKMKGGEV